MRYFLERGPASPTNYRYPVTRVVYRGRSPYQSILVFDSPKHGRVLALDEIVQLTTREEPFYHELLVHPAMQAHPVPRRALIIGGGDGGAARELCKYPDLREIVQVELDEEVVRIARRYLPRVAFGYRDPRVQLIFADGSRYLQAQTEPFDLILTDLTDPIGPAKPLFQEPFYRLCSDHLTDQGMLCAQTESVHFHPDTVRQVQAALRTVFPFVECLNIPLAMYPGNWWTFGLAGKSLDPKIVRNPHTPETSIYGREYHAWFFLPSLLRDRLLAPRPAKQRRIRAPSPTANKTRTGPED